LTGEGPDQDSYYHPRFLRGLPHLCKDMQRLTSNNNNNSSSSRGALVPAASTAPDAELASEPDLAKISELLPVPDYNVAVGDTTVRLDWFLRFGKRRVKMTCARTPVATVVRTVWSSATWRDAKRA
jgi:hypothetical protein